MTGDEPFWIGYDVARKFADALPNVELEWAIMWTHIREAVQEWLDNPAAKLVPEDRRAIGIANAVTDALVSKGYRRHESS